MVRMTVGTATPRRQHPLSQNTKHRLLILCGVPPPTPVPCQANNYMEGCIWEGVFTEYRAAHNIITGNTVIGPVANNAHIHLNGELNYAVENTVRFNDTVPGGIAVSSSLAMYGSYVMRACYHTHPSAQALCRLRVGSVSAAAGGRGSARVRACGGGVWWWWCWWVGGAWWAWLQWACTRWSQHQRPSRQPPADDNWIGATVIRYALSNVVLANSAGTLTFNGDGQSRTACSSDTTRVMPGWGA